MSTNKINIEAVNARAREEQTPMTKKLSVEDTSRHFCNGIALQLKPSNAVMETIRLLNKELPQALTAEREAGAREYRQFILNVLDGTDIADGECNTKAIRFAIASRIIK